MKAYERLLKYVVVRTPSDENSETVPSSQCQFNLAKLLETEMKELGLKDVHLDDQCYLYGNLPATAGYEDKPAIGFIAHMDTVADFCDHDIVPVLTENYSGEAMEIGKSGLILSPETFPHLASLKGRTLITSDGTTVLGADDKAGIAEILTMIERVQAENIPHGKLCVAFTPDEEIGTGAAHFNVEKFGADYGYTMDGDTEGEIQYENFNACKACFDIKGFSVHPGSSKDTMINASLVAIEINNMLPGCETPRGTEEYEGFYHLVSMSGECGSAQLNYFVRDHSKELFEARKKTLQLIEKDLNEKWGEGTVTLTITEQYKNMAEIIAGCMHLIDNAKAACEAADVTPLIIPIRGGTDGCQLSFKGLPCPNLGTGGHAYHGPYEHITVEGMDKSVDVMMELVKLYAK
jgi:peptidase T